MMKIEKWFWLALAATMSCGADLGPGVSPLETAHDPIINGTPAAPEDFPATGVLLVKGKVYGMEVGSMICTGTLVAPDTVLLAAHCIDIDLLAEQGLTNPYFYFSFATDVSKFGQAGMELPANTYPVRRYQQHAGFSMQAFNDFSGGLGEFNDVGLVFLDSAVTDRVPAMVLGPQDSTALTVGTEVEIVGYGVRSSDYNPMTGGMDEAGIKYKATSEINEIGPAEMQIGNVAPTPQKCHGDSGGPTYLDFSDGLEPKQRLVGITSHAYDQTDCDKGGVDTRVDAYRDWIDANMIAGCQDAWRVACTGGPGLAMPKRPPSQGNNPQNVDDNGAGNYYSKTFEDETGCRAVRPTWIAVVAGLLVLGGTRGRRRRRT